MFAKLSDAPRKGQQSKRVVENAKVKGVAYTKAPAETVGVLKKLLRAARSKVHVGRQQTRPKEIAFSSW
jgi:hypothetical protein